MSEIETGTVGTVVQHDHYDALAYQETLEMYPRLSTTVNEQERRLPTAPALIEDVFYSLFCPSPTLLSQDELPLYASVNRSIIEEMMQTTEWEGVRRVGTVGDQLYAGIATATVAKSILTTLDKKIVQRLQELHDAEAEAAKLFERAEALDDLAGQVKDDRAQYLYDQAKAARKEAEEHQEDAENLAEKLEEQSEQIEDATRRAARVALEAAEAEVDATEEMMKALTGGYSTGSRTGGSGGATPLSLKEKMSLAQEVGRSTKLKQIMELTGRMTRIALQCQKSRIKHPPDEIVGINIGDDLAHTLPVELGLLADPDLEVLFFKKYLEKQLLQLDLVGSEKQGRGPIVVALDSSNSMTQALGGRYSKEVWSKAVVMALLAIARLQKRDLAVIHFAHAEKIKVFEFPRGEGKPQDVLATAEYFINGGTRYEDWMKEALCLIEQSKYNRADTIVVSDGEVSISGQLEADWNRRRAARGMRCYGVLLGAAGYARVLSRVCDGLATIDNLASDNDALAMMFSL